MTQKATRIEFIEAVDNYIQRSRDIKKSTVLEISGNTVEWTRHFEKKQSVYFPDVDAEDLPFEDEKFDCIIFNQILEHCKRPWICINEAYRVTKKEGIIILSSPFFYQIHDWPGDYYRFTPDGLIAMSSSSGFSKILLKHKSGNSEMIKHMIDNPTDRRSKKFLDLAKNKNLDKSKYFTISTVIMQKL